MPELDLRLLVDHGDLALVVRGCDVPGVRRRLRGGGRAVDVYGLHPTTAPAVAVDLSRAAPAAWFFGALLEPASWRGLAAQRAAGVLARSPLRHRLFGACLVVGRAT